VERELTSLNAAKTTKAYGAGEVVYAEGEECRGVYCIESGLIGLRKHDLKTRTTLMRLRGPGDTIGYRALLTNMEHQVAAKVLIPSQICFIDKELATWLFANVPSLGLQFLQNVLGHLAEAEEYYFQNVTQTARARVLCVLLSLYERLGEALPSGERVLKLPLSRRDLAALAGISPETLSRTMRRLESERIASFKGRQVCFMNMVGLLDEFELSDSSAGLVTNDSGQSNAHRSR
jgi:CRP/FNR family transcriptional regulator